MFERKKKEESGCDGDETSVMWRVCMSVDEKRRVSMNVRERGI